MPAARSMIVTLLVWFGVAGAASADRVDDLMRKLRSAPDYKVRLSAALSLGKLGDQRAVPAFVDALQDSDRSVRSVAAGALGKLINKKTPRDDQARALAALEDAAKGDPDQMVRTQARRAADALRVRGPAGIYVEVGQMTDATRKSPRMPGVMRQIVLTSLGQHAPSFVTRWASGRSPSEADLKRSRSVGFFVDGSLTALNVVPSPPRVSCSVSLLIATYPGKSMFAFLKGGAEVDPGVASEAALADATTECLSAALDAIVSSDIVPTIESRAE